jgi:hypothetical protein
MMRFLAGYCRHNTLADRPSETLIFTRPKVGYMLNVRKESVLILT